MRSRVPGEYYLSKPKDKKAASLDGSKGFALSEPEPTRAAVIVPVLPDRYNSGSAGEDGARSQFQRSNEARLEEAIGLARAIGLDIEHAEIAIVTNPRPATLLGAGKAQSIAEVVKEKAIGLVVVDHALTPVQQRNLEKEWNAKVIDRTGLILEIFGERARTKEGALQVELAHLNYQKGRLVRSWTTLNASAAVGASLAARVKPRSKLTDACFRKKSCASSASLKPWCARARCIARSGARCRIQLLRLSAIPMRENPRFSTA